MKPGSESDPFDEEPPEDEPRHADPADLDEPRDPEPDIDSGAGGAQTAVQTSQEPPYVLRRSTVKEDREMVQFFLRDEFTDGERDLRQAVEEIVGTDVKKTDLREAAYAIAQEHPEEIAELLLEWGYEYR